MPFILGAIAILGTIFYYVMMARNAASMSSDVMDVASDVMAAARRLGFRRNKALHPVESLEDPKTAIASIGLAFLDANGLPSSDDHKALEVALRKHLDIDGTYATEALVLGRWINTQCGTFDAAITRVGKRLFKLGGKQNFDPMMAVLDDLSGRQDSLSERQLESLQELKRVFHI